MKNKSTLRYARLFLLCATVISMAFSCGDGGSDYRDEVVIIDEPREEARSCSGTPLGSTRDQVCDAGYTGSKLLVCTNDGWVEKSNSCQKIIGECEEASEQKVNFEEDIKPQIELKNFF